ncbi:MAG: bifunctional hydroxymethylpyrimidine kinase/phosphomethylpyrimidine kinase, partial [Comamonadaceae bacterium]
LGARAALVKGGHLRGDDVIDVLALAGPPATFAEIRAARIASGNTHGTGCTLSSAIACGLALGQSLPDAVRAAAAYVRAAMTSGATVRTGHGHGPLDHGHAPVPSRRLPLT